MREALESFAFYSGGRGGSNMAAAAAAVTWAGLKF
jgi:hypothetical protein